jgi:DnaJ-domain-containing protein 1
LEIHEVARSEAGLCDRLDQMRKADPYALFGVTRDTDLPKIKRAYREMVSTYHPDKADPFLCAFCGGFEDH